MGVHGLHSWVQAQREAEQGPLGEEVALTGALAASLGAEPLLAVDGNSLVHHLVRGAWRGDGRAVVPDYARLADLAREFVARFRAEGLGVAAVFDGREEAGKDEQRARQGEERERAARGCWPAGEGDERAVPDLAALGDRLPLPLLAEAAVVEALRGAAALVAHADGENDAAVARLAAERGCVAVVGLDSDYYVLAARYVPLDSLRGARGTLHRRAAVAARLRVPEAALPLLASLVGTDFATAKVLERVHRALVPGEAAPSWGSLLPAAAAAVRDARETAAAAAGRLARAGGASDAEAARAEEAVGRSAALLALDGAASVPLLPGDSPARAVLTLRARGGALPRPVALGLACTDAGPRYYVALAGVRARVEGLARGGGGDLREALFDGTGVDAAALPAHLWLPAASLAWLRPLGLGARATGALVAAAALAATGARSPALETRRRAVLADAVIGRALAAALFAAEHAAQLALLAHDAAGRPLGRALAAPASVCCPLDAHDAAASGLGAAELLAGAPGATADAAARLAACAGLDTTPLLALPRSRPWYPKVRRARGGGGGDGEPVPRASSPSSLKYCSERPTYRYSVEDRRWAVWDGRVRADAGDAADAGGAVSAITWNVLFDTYLPADVDTAARTNALLAELEREDAELVALEEVTQPFLATLLSCEWVRRRYYCSDGGAGETLRDLGGAAVRDAKRPSGQVLLSRRPFHLWTLSFSRHKRALLAQVAPGAGGRRPAVFALVLHLTSDHHGSMQRRTQQLRQALPFLACREAEGAARLVLGDLNYSDGEEGEEYAQEMLSAHGLVDAWLAARPRDAGHTYCPATNTLARLTNDTGASRRLDRVFASSAHLAAAGARLLGTATVQAGSDRHHPSDHYGLRVDLVPAAAPRGEAGEEEKGEEHAPYEGGARKADSAVPGLAAAGPLEEALEACGVRETDEGNAGREEALALLGRLLPRACLGPGVRAEDAPPDDEVCRLFPVGSYALGTHFRSSDVDVLCVSAAAADDFFRAAPVVLASSPLVRVVHVLGPRRAVVPLLRLVVIVRGARQRVAVDLQYACHAPAAGLRRFDPAAMPERERRRLDLASSAGVNACVDTGVIVRSAAGGSPARAARLRALITAVSLWARRRGVYGSRFGLLSGIAIAVMAGRVAQRWPAAPAGELAARFFATYDAWDWDARAVCLLHQDAACGTASFRARCREPMAVACPAPPHKNVMRSCTPSSARAVRAELRAAAAARSWDALWEASRAVPDAYPSYLRVCLSAVTRSEYMAWVGYAESRFVALDMAFERGVRGAALRVWPARYEARDGGAWPFSGVYYFGVERLGGGPVTFATEVIKFVDALQEWEGMSKNMDVQVRHVRARAVQAAAPLMPCRALDPLAFVDAAEADARAAAELAEAVGGAAAQAAAPQAAVAAAPALIRFDDPEAARPRERLTTSEEFYSRVRWDPALDHTQWAVVYLDRFRGMVETSFERFRPTNDPTREDFIPWTRVWFFKCCGRVVWDRKARVDLLTARGVE